MESYQLSRYKTGLDFDTKVIQLDENPFIGSKTPKFSKWYKIVSIHNEKTILLYIAKGNQLAPREVVPFYPNGKMHTSYKLTFVNAVEMAVQDAIYYI